MLLREPPATEHPVHDIHDLRRTTHGDGKLQVLTSSAFAKRLHVFGVNRGVRAIAVDGLLLVTDKRKTTRFRAGRTGLPRPGADFGIPGTGQLAQHGKHVGVRVLRFVEDHHVALGPEPAQHSGTGQQLARPKDLVAIRHHPALQPIRKPGFGKARGKPGGGGIEPADIRPQPIFERLFEGAAAGAEIRQLEKRPTGLVGEIRDPAAKAFLMSQRRIPRLGILPAARRECLREVWQDDFVAGIRRGGTAQQRLDLGGIQLTGEVEQLLECQVTLGPGQGLLRQRQGGQFLAVAKARPKRVLLPPLGEQLRIRRHADEPTEVIQQFQAKRVDRAEKRPPQIGQKRLPLCRAGVAELRHEPVARAHAEFLGGKVGVGHHDEPREHLRLALALQGEAGDAVRDRPRLADAGACGDAEIFSGFGDEPVTRLRIGERRGQGSGHCGREAFAAGVGGSRIFERSMSAPRARK